MIWYEMDLAESSSFQGHINGPSNHIIRGMEYTLLESKRYVASFYVAWRP